MERYNYETVIKEDIKNYIKDMQDSENLSNEDIIGMEDAVYAALIVDDSVTGNGSGSYTFSTYKAEENLCHNLDLLGEACAEYCIPIPLDNPEACDVLIRCYLLHDLLSEVLNELED